MLSTSGEARSAGAAIGAAVLLGSLAAAAQPAHRDPIAAEALFRAARDLVAEGRYAEGCPKFEASFDLYPSTGTLLNIAKCHEHEGKIVAAWADYSRALALNLETLGAERQKALDEIARQGIAALAPRLPRLRVVVKQAPAGLKVLRDGKEMPASAFGEALPAEPGPHEVTASAPGYRTESRSVRLEEGKTALIEIALAPEDTPAARGGVPAWAWISGGAGLALAGAGVFFLTQDLTAIRALQENCYIGAGTSSCKPGYDFQSDNARKNRSLALALGLGGAGVIAIGAAVVGIARAPSAKKAVPASNAALSPWFEPGGGGLVLRGGF